MTLRAARELASARGVHVRVAEAGRERIEIFQGVVMRRQGDIPSRSGT